MEWKSFALYGTLQECLSVMVYSIPVILYVNKFGENIGGQFSMAFKVTFAPIVLISSSLAQVLTQKFGRENDFSILKKVVWFDKRFLVLIVFILFLPFVFANSGLNIMNRKWDVSIQIIPYLLLNSFFFLFANPFRIALRILKRNADILKIEIGTVVALGLVFSLLDVNVIMLTICMTTITFFQNMFLILAYFSQKKSKAN